jgi:hypothetical protein
LDKTYNKKDQKQLVRKIHSVKYKKCFGKFLKDKKFNARLRLLRVAESWCANYIVSSWLARQNHMLRSGGYERDMHVCRSADT